MGMRNWFKKTKLFDKEGFYIVLFVCLCIVAVAAVYLSRSSNMAMKKVSDGTGQIQQEPQDKIDLVEKDNNTVPVVKPPESDSKPKPTAKPTNTPTKPKPTNTPTPKPTEKVTPKPSGFSLALPVDGLTAKSISKGFSKEELAYSSTMNQWETHEAIDLTCDIGSPVKAARAGKVVDVVKNDNAVDTILKNGYGVTVILEHEGGYRTVYSNLADTITNDNGETVDAVTVKKGDTVKEGQVIGQVGDTSVREMVSIEGSHLHFAVLAKNSSGAYETVDPTKYMNLK